MTQLKDLGYVVIAHDEALRALTVEWRGGFRHRNIRQGLDAALAELAKLPPGTAWIGDTTNIGVISTEDQAWIDSDWFPRLLRTGTTHMAVVLPASEIAKLSVSSILARVQGTPLTVFNTERLDEARSWVASRVGR
jgi:hypothetical protein